MADEARYSVGIDLGTTNCAVAYVDLASDDGDAARTQIRSGDERPIREPRRFQIRH